MLKKLLSVAVASLVYSSFVSAGVIEGGPSIDMFAHNTVWEVSNVSTQATTSTATSGNATANFSGCRFSGADGQPSSLDVSTDWAVSLGLHGAASGTLNCSMEFDYTILSIDPSGPGGSAIAVLWELATLVSFNPDTEYASYGWTVFGALFDDNGNFLFGAGEPNREELCDSAHSTAGCHNFYDYNVAPFFDLAAGDHGHASLTLDLHFDVRSVPEPGGVLLLLLGATGVAWARRRKQ